jgi:stress response protein YsnF
MSEQLTRRVGRTEQDARAVADTVAEIRDTQLQHGRKLDTIEERLGALETQVTAGFVEILRRLDAR